MPPALAGLRSQIIICSEAFAILTNSSKSMLCVEYTKREKLLSMEGVQASASSLRSFNGNLIRLHVENFMAKLTESSRADGTPAGG